jgi:type IV pilus assembly protein PilY1
MSIRKIRDRLAIVAAAAGFSLLTAQAATAAPLNIADTPMFLTTGVKPNLIMAIDDSGSMDFEVLLPGNDGSAWWRAGASGSCTTALNDNSFYGCVANGSTDLPGTRLNFNNSGNAGTGWKKFTYLFPNGSASGDTDRRRSGDSTNDHFAIPPLTAFGWSRSPDFNRAYFNPATKYEPWVDGGGFTFNDATAAAAEYDPVFGGAGTVNLTTDIAGDRNVAISAACTNVGITGSNTPAGVTANYYFRVYSGMVIPTGTCMRVNGRSWETTQAACAVGAPAGCRTNLTPAGYQLNSGSSVAIRYYPATFYLSTATVPADADGVEFGYTATPAADGQAPDGTLLYRYEIKPENFTDPAKYSAAIQNFANWFTYSRKRHLALRAGLGEAFQDLAATRVAGFTINGATTTSPNVTMGDIDVAANRTALYTNFYDTWVGTGGTPNRTAVTNLIRNFRRTDGSAPVTHSCQRNFGMLFTDGFSNQPDAGDGIAAIAGGNADGSAGAPYQDSTSNTMADAVLKAYNTPLRTGTGFPLGRVLPVEGCDVTTPDAWLDCNKNLHMNFYAITLGTRGLQFDPDADPEQNPYVTAPTWPTTFPPRHPSAVDDIWHATINGRGKLLNAKSSDELADKLKELLGSLNEGAGTASTAAVSTGSVGSDTRLFQVSFDAEDWSGNLTAQQFATGGVLGAEVNATIPAPNARQIVTSTATGAPVAFTWDAIGPVRQAQLEPANDGLGDERLAWLRGDQSGEAPAATNFRKRTKLLGDIINSAPAFVGAPAFRYSDALETEKYSDFRAAHMDRTHMVYAGANDGMLHAFSSDDSSDAGAVRETFAFIPKEVFRNLHLLTSRNYTHRFYVDGSPVTGDAFVGGEWRTILVSGLNKGGQEVFALDVTDPSSLTEASASSIVKWEFTDANDADLGYTYSRPSIVRTNDSTAGRKWVAAFGNGYNNTVADGNASITGNAFLYVVNLHTGALIRKIDTGVGLSNAASGGKPNGLSTPVFVDIDGDSDVDYAYAGDLYGNLWKFNLTSANPDDWHVAYSGEPFFVAKDGSGNRQPITTRPNVGRGPRGVGLIVLFGTGKYLEATDVDLALMKTQTFYGLLDPNTGASTDLITSRTALTEQSIMFEAEGVVFTDSETGATNEVDIRQTSRNVLGSTSRGWFMDLVSPANGFEGEMQVTDSVIRLDHVIFTTLIPSADPCESGGTGWLMELDLFTGGKTDKTPWDFNLDNEFNDEDMADLDGDGNLDALNGTRDPSDVNPGIPVKPASLFDEQEGCDWLIFPSTSGHTGTRCRNPGARGFGRQSWRQAH